MRSSSVHAAARTADQEKSPARRMRCLAGLLCHTRKEHRCQRSGRRSTRPSPPGSRRGMVRGTGKAPAGTASPADHRYQEPRNRRQQDPGRHCGVQPAGEGHAHRLGHGFLGRDVPAAHSPPTPNPGKKRKTAKDMRPAARPHRAGHMTLTRPSGRQASSRTSSRPVRA